MLKRMLVKIACKYIQKHGYLNLGMEDIIYLKYYHGPFKITSIEVHQNLNSATEVYIKLTEKDFRLYLNKKY